MESLFTIKPGIIDIESVYVIHRVDEAVVWAINCFQKYPAILSISGSVLMLGSNEDTMKVKDYKLPPTVVEIKLPSGNWCTFAEAGRYDIYVCSVIINSLNPDFDSLAWFPK
jgi:hypothetical protein